jgi:hypothetical protein
MLNVVTTMKKAKQSSSPASNKITQKQKNKNEAQQLSQQSMMINCPLLWHFLLL